MSTTPLFPYPKRPDGDLAVNGWLDLIARRFAADSVVSAKSAAFTPESEIQWFRVSASGGAIAVTVPLAASYPYRRIGFIKTDSGANAVTLSRSGSDTINGATSFAIGTQYQVCILKSNGITAWDVENIFNTKGSYTATGTGFTTSPTATFTYSIVGNVVTLNMTAISGTSNATTFTATGMPAEARPASQKSVIGMARDNGGAFLAVNINVETSGTLTIFSNTDSAAFTASGSKILAPCSVSYTLV